MTAEIAALAERIAQLSPANVGKPTLVYFDVIGLAWPIRCLLHRAEVDHDLVQVSIMEWAYRDQNGVQPVKTALINGHVPYYVDQDVEISQSVPLMMYLADRHGLAGSDTASRTRVMEVVCHAYDALFHTNGIIGVNIFGSMGREQGLARERAFMGETEYGLATGGFAGHLDGFSRYLSRNTSDSGWFVGDEITIADLAAYNAIANWYKAFSRDGFAAYPQLDAFIQQVAADPGVADYIATKQEPTTWFRLPEVALRLTSEEELIGLVG